VGKKKAKNQALPAKPPRQIVVPVSQDKLRKQLGLFIVIFSFALYAQSIFFDYAYDDLTVIQGNNLVKGGVKSIPDLISSDYWYGFTGVKKGPIYRPISLIMFATEWTLFPDNPMPNHIINVLLFSLTCFLLFVLLCRLLKENLLFPFICVLLYTAHPIHTEVVNNIKSRDEILCFLFSVTALLFYLDYYSRKRILSYLVGALFFFLAILSKETAIGFLVIIPLSLFVFKETNFRRLIYCTLSLLVIALGYLAIRQLLISSHRPLGEGIELMDNTLVSASNYFKVLATAIYILLKYVGLLLFPHPLSNDYSYNQVALKSFGDPIVLFASLFFIAITTFSIIMIRKKNLYAYGILFFLVTIFPVSNIAFLFGSTMAERFLYMPSFGFCIVLTLLLLQITKAIKKTPISNSFNGFYRKFQLPLIIVASISVLYSVKTLIRSRDWRNNLLLFKSASEASSGSARAHYGYAAALFSSALAKEGDEHEIAENYDLSKKEYQTALSIYPQYSDAYTGLGLFYKNIGDFKNAVDNFERAANTTRQPKLSLYKDLGYSYLKNAQFEKSIAALDSALMIDPGNVNVLNFKGSALYGLQKYSEALAVYMKATQINPADLDIVKNIGRCYFYLKQYDNAATYFKRCLDSQPDNIENYQFLALTYQMTGDTARANPLLRQAEQMKSAQQK